MAQRGRPAGQPKTGGRKKGTPNKDKQALIEMIQAKHKGYHPVLAMAAIANDKNNDLELRFQAHKEVAQYIEPKRKAIEHSGEVGTKVKLVDLTGGE